MKYFALVQLIDPKKAGLPQTNDNVIRIVLTDVFITFGAIAFLMLVLAGFRYILARGNADKTSQAKNLIIYSLIGLIIAALAGSIVNVVISRLST